MANPVFMITITDATTTHLYATAAHPDANTAATAAFQQFQADNPTAEMSSLNVQQFTGKVI